MSSNLVAFLLACIAEDEMLARDADPGPWMVDAGGCSVVASTDKSDVVAEWTFDAGQHIAHHDPARVLAECEAKRRIIELHREYQQRPFASTSRTTLELMALPYADHPGYREEWSP